MKSYEPLIINYSSFVKVGNLPSVTIEVISSGYFPKTIGSTYHPSWKACYLLAAAISSGSDEFEGSIKSILFAIPIIPPCFF